MKKCFRQKLYDIDEGYTIPYSHLFDLPMTLKGPVKARSKFLNLHLLLHIFVAEIETFP